MIKLCREALHWCMLVCVKGLAGSSVCTALHASKVLSCNLALQVAASKTKWHVSWELPSTLLVLVDSSAAER